MSTTSNFIPFSLSLLLLLSSLLSHPFADPLPSQNDPELDDIDELIAVDEQEEQQQLNGDVSSDAKVLSRAQKIVVELNNDNTQKLIQEREFVLVLGYTPWDPRSAELMPHFAEAANLLNDLGSPVLMAKIDAERYPKTASFLGIKGYPTLLLFSNGSSQAYTGGFTAEDIMIWAKKKSGEAIVRVGSVGEAEEFVKKYSMFVVGLFEKFESSDYEEFVKAAISDNEIQFVETDSVEAAKILFQDGDLKNHFLGLVKSEPERYTMFEGSLEADKILQFLEYAKFPLVTILTELNAVRVYASPIKLQVYVFAETDDFKKLVEPLRDVARKFKSKIMFIYVDIKEDNLAKPLMTLLGLEESETTVVAAFDNKISSKYLLESEPSPSKIEEFCLGILDGTVSQYFKSQPIPNNKEANVQVVVGKTFDEFVLGSSSNVLLEVYTPWCMNCEATSKQVEKLAKHFKGLNNLVFAKIDASANEHPKLEVTEYPTLLFYPAADKSNPIKVSSKSSLKNLAAFIKRNAQMTKDEL